MPISINWGTKVISIPQSYLTNITGTLYELDTDQFRLDLKDLEDNEEGMPFDDTHRHNTEVAVAGITYARTIEIINGYSITFEDAQYTVRLAGSNNNIFDVENSILNQNQVQIISTNSAGLQVVVQGSGVTEQDKLDIADRVWDEDIDDHTSTGSTGEALDDIDVSGLALEATAQDIKDKTDNLPTDPADQSAVEAAIITAESNIRGIDSDDLKVLSDQLDTAQADLDDPDQYKANLAGLAPAGEYDFELANIQADLDNPNQFKADISALGLEATLQLIKTETDKITTMETLLTFIGDIEGGRWRIENNQMIFYKADNITEVARFNLYDEDGQPAAIDVFQRRRV